MKKITLLLFIATLSTVSVFSQYNFTTVTGPVDVTNGASVTENINDAANNSGVSAGNYIDFIVTADWVSTNNSWASESELTLTTAGGSINIAPPSTGSTNSGDATTITFEGTLPGGAYDPSVDGLLTIEMIQSYTGSSADWSNIVVTIIEAPACPDPTTLVVNNFMSPSSADISWVASAGATAYNWEIQPQGSAQGTAGAIDSGMLAGTTTSTSNLVDGTSYTLYVQSDCGGALGNWVSLDFTFLLLPSNDECANATVVTSLPYNYSQNAGAATNNSGFLNVCVGMNDGVWYTFTAATSGTVDVSVDATSNWDHEIAMYSGSCGTFTCEDSADGGFTGDIETLTGVMVTAGTQYWINIGYWSSATDAAEGEFVIDITTSDTTTLGIEELQVLEGFKYFPNPANNKLTVQAQHNIESLQLVSMLGQVVRTAQPNEQSYSLDISDLSSGIYFIKAKVNNTEGTFRVVKQ